MIGFDLYYTPGSPKFKLCVIILGFLNMEENEFVVIT